MGDKPVCPKCGSKDMIPNVQITDGRGGYVEATAYEKPAAIVLKGAHHSQFSATVCGQCGYAELFVTHPAELLAPIGDVRQRD